MSAHPYRIAIVGGSHAGLLTALALRRAGADVEVYERAPGPLEARGAGLRIQPLMAEILRDAGIDLAPASTFTHFDRHIGPGNRIVFEQPEIAAARSSESIDLAVPGSPTSSRPRFPARPTTARCS